jgi:hypothetical protein
MPSTSSSSKLSKMEKGKDYPDLPRPYPMMPKTIRKAQPDNKNKRPEIEKPRAFKTKFTKKIHNGVGFSKMKIWREGEKTPLSTLSTLSTTSIGPQSYSPTQLNRINSKNSAKSSDTFGQFINIERNKSNSSRSKGIKTRKYTHKKNKKAKNTRRRKNLHKKH